MSASPQLAFYALAVLATLIAAVTDTRSGRIPNWLTYPLLVVSPLAWGVCHGLREAVVSLLGLALCGAVPAFFFTRNAMGGGDVKLFAALGALLGPSTGIEVQFFSYTVLTFLLLARMAWEGRLFSTLATSLRAGLNLVLPQRLRRPLEPAMLTSMRMGVAICAATLLSLLLKVQEGAF